MIQLLEFIKMEMGEIAGVTAQRQGQIANRETVGGVERSVNQSSHITEYWFMLHEECKLRVLETFLETAKIALKGNNKKTQYILDDQSIQILNIEGDEFSENDYGLVCTNSSRTQELEQFIKQSAQAFVQNGGGFSTVMDIYFSPSLMDMRRKLEEAEELQHQRSQEASQQQSKDQQAAMAQQAELENRKLELQDLMNQRDNDTKYQIALLGTEEEPEVVDDGIEDPLAYDKFNLDVQKRKDDYVLKMKALNNDMKKHADDVVLKKESNAISRIKKKTASK
jgi:hypothetical protein